MKVIRQITSVFLALLVLMASSSFYLSAHSCGGQVKEVAFLQKADGCGHQSMPPCHRQMMKGCCEDEQIAHEAQDVKSEAQLHASSLLPAFTWIATSPVLAEVIPSSPIFANNFFHYDTPLLAVDLVVTQRVLLI